MEANDMRAAAQRSCRDNRSDIFNVAPSSGVGWPPATLAMSAQVERDNVKFAGQRFSGFNPLGCAPGEAVEQYDR
jgi:hypothetical protein